MRRTMSTRARTRVRWRRPDGSAASASCRVVANSDAATVAGSHKESVRGSAHTNAAIVTGMNDDGAFPSTEDGNDNRRRRQSHPCSRRHRRHSHSSPRHCSLSFLQPSVDDGDSALAHSHSHAANTTRPMCRLLVARSRDPPSPPTARPVDLPADMHTPINGITTRASTAWTFAQDIRYRKDNNGDDRRAAMGLASMSTRATLGWQPPLCAEKVSSQTTTAVMSHLLRRRKRKDSGSFCLSAFRLK